jgi:hypothetical protein
MATKKINTDLQLTAKLLDGNSSAGTSGQVLSSTGTATDWISLNDIYYTETEADNRFLRSDANDTATGNLTFNGQVNLNSTVRLNPNGTNFEIDTDTSERVVFSFNVNGTRNWSLRHDADLNFYRDSGAGQVQINGSRILTTADEGSGNGLDADTLDSYHETSFIRLAPNSNSPTNGYFAIGHASGRNFIQSHAGQPLDINPLGNNITLCSGGSGNVGIGTTDPAGKLNVALPADSNGNVSAWSSNQVVFTRGGTSTSQGIGFSVHDANNTATISSLTPAITWSVLEYRALAHFFYSTGSTLGIMQNSSGYVGIGTTNATQKLTIGQSGESINYIRIIATTADLYVGANATGSHLGVTNGAKILQTDSYPLVIGTTANQEVYLGANNATIATLVDGKFGIGTTSPNELLHISRGSSGSGLLLENTTGGSGSYITLDFNTYNVDQANFANAGASIRVIDDGAYSGDITFRTKGAAINAAQTEKMRIDGATGNVGIGETNPGSKLHVAGDAYITGQLGQGVSITNKIYNYGSEFRSNSASIQIAFGRDGNNIGSGAIGADGVNCFAVWNTSSTTKKMVVSQGGNVGIGTDDPGQKLSVAGNIALVSNNSFISFNTSASSGDPKIQMGSDGDFSFLNTAGSNNLHIENGGNVGIGETSVDAKLHLTAASAGLINQKFESAGSAAWRLGIPASQTYFAFDNANDNLSAPKVVIDSDGKVGIGTDNPGAELEVSLSGNPRIRLTSTNNVTSTLQFADADDVNVGFIQYDHGVDAMEFRVNDSERMRITSTGGISFGSTGTAYGTSGQILKSNANASPTWVDASTVIGGPYLPLSAGLSYPLTGDLFIEGASTPKITLTDTTNNLEGRIRVANNYMYIEADDSNTVGSTIILLKTDGAEALRLDGNQNATFAGTIAVQGTGDSYFQGYVGIGVTNPLSNLHIEGTEPILQIRETSGTSEAGISINHAVSGNQYNWFVGTIDGSPRKFTIGATVTNGHSTATAQAAASLFTINQDGGNVGIGTTTPTAPLHIEGGTTSEVLKIEADTSPYIRWVQNGTNVGFLQFTSGTAYLSNMSNGAFIFRTNNTDKMIITSGGNVGIGTDSPGSELEVDGEITTTTITYDEPGALDSSAYNGEIVYFGTQISMTEGKLMVLSASAGGLTWYLARDNSASLSTGMLGIALGTTASAGVLVRGIAKNSAWSSFSEGEKLYLSPTSGSISNSITQDTNDFVRIVGYALGGNKIYFCPDNTYVQNS